MTKTNVVFTVSMVAPQEWKLGVPGAPKPAVALTFVPALKTSGTTLSSGPPFTHRPFGVELPGVGIVNSIAPVLMLKRNTFPVLKSATQADVPFGSSVSARRFLELPNA